MRLVFLVFSLALAACSAAPAPQATPPTPQPAPPSAPSGETCTDLAMDSDALFDATPMSWVPAASPLLGCAPEAISGLLGAADSTQRDGMALLQYTRQRPRGTATLIVAVGEAGVVGVSIAEEVPRRLSETVFVLRAEQAREVAGAEPIPSPEATRVFPATAARPFGIRLVRTEGVLVLSVVRE